MGGSGDARKLQGTDGPNRRQLLKFAGIGGAGILGVAAATALTGAVAPHAAPKPRVVADRGPLEAWLYLTIVPGTPEHPQWPAYIPADFTVPSEALVHVEIRCFDPGTAVVPSGYERVQGTVGGTEEVTGTVEGVLSNKPSRTVTTLASTNVAHTFTFAEPKLSVPIPPLSTVRFAFKTGAAGHYGWQCMAACGTGNGGWGGPMSTQGYMAGTMTVTA